MRTLPRHLLLAAVVLTLCCAERQAVASTAVELQKAAFGEAGERAIQQRAAEQIQVRRLARQRYVRPAALAWRDQVRATFAPAVAARLPERPLVHVIYPPSRFRLPPPAFLA